MQNPFGDTPIDASLPSQENTSPFGDTLVAGDTASRGPISSDEFNRLMSSIDDGGPEASDYLMRFLSGFSDMGSGLVQLGAQAAEKMGFERAGEFRKDFENFRNALERTNEIDAPGAGGAAVELAGKIAPALAVPGGVQGNLATRIATGSLAGGGIGAAEFVGEDESRLANTGKGLAFGAVGPAVLSGGSTLGASAMKAGARFGASVDDISKTLRDFAVSGSSPTLGQATDNKFLQGAETLIGKYWGGGKIAAQLDDTTAKVQQTLAKMADDISPVRGSDSAGRVIQKGITGEGGFVDRFLGESGKLWNRVDSAIGGMSVNAANTKNTLDSLVSDGRLASVLNDPKIVKMRDAFAGAGDDLPYEELKALRSIVGRKLGSKELVSDMPRAELKQIYAAISSDIEGAARAAGDDAMQAYSRANKYTRAGHGRIDDFLERTTNKQELDKVFNAVVKGGDGSQVINSFKRSLKPDEWEAVVSNVIRNMGKATSSRQDEFGEVFSLGTFLTNWDKLGPAKKALFSGSNKINKYGKDLDSIAATASRVRSGLQEMANNSETARASVRIGSAATAATGAVAGVPAIPAGILASIGANASSAALLTSPRFVNWLASTSKAKPSAMPSQIAKLATIATEVPESTAEAINGLLIDLKKLPELGTQQGQQEQ